MVPQHGGRTSEKVDTELRVGACGERCVVTRRGLRRVIRDEEVEVIFVTFATQRYARAVREGDIAHTRRKMYGAFCTKQCVHGKKRGKFWRVMRPRQKQGARAVMFVERVQHGRAMCVDTRAAAVGSAYVQMRWAGRLVYGFEWQEM